MRSLLLGIGCLGVAFLLPACDDSVVNPDGDSPLTRGEYQVKVNYDFDDGLIPDWSGNAGMAVEDGALRLTAGHNQWRYKTFDPVFPGRFQSGTFQFEVTFGPQAYFFDLKGHSESNLYSHQLGPAVHFIRGEIWIDDGEFKDTGTQYTPGLRYRIRGEFWNEGGDRGLYSLYLEEIDLPASRLSVGTYSYKAPDGRLADITEFGFSGRNLDEVVTTSFLIDNVQLVLHGPVRR